MSYGQHFFIRARPGAVWQPDCKAVLLRQRSLTERHRYGAVARYRSDTGSEPNMTSGNSWEKRQVCGIDKIEIGTQLFEVKLCAACRTQQVVCKSSRSKRRGARCIGDRVGVLPNGSMHPDVPASTFVVVKLTGGLRTTSSPPVLPESQAVRRGVPPYSETRGTCPRMACAGPQPTGIRAI